MLTRLTLALFTSILHTFEQEYINLALKHFRSFKLSKKIQIMIIRIELFD